jgi:hypothetical protein
VVKEIYSFFLQINFLIKIQPKEILQRNPSQQSLSNIPNSTTTGVEPTKQG